MFVIGTVAGPEDVRLLEWAKHWRHRGQILVFVQASPEWLKNKTAAELYALCPSIEIIPALPSGNADLHWNSLILLAEQYNYDALITCKGTDEFMAEDNWKLLKKLVRADQEVRVFWLSYRDYFDGQYFKEMGAGADYHPVVLRGQPLYYGGQFHTWPSPRCGVEDIRYLPESIIMEHRRTIAEVISANKARESYARPQEIQVQNQFLQKLQQVCETHGIVFPKQEQT